VLYMSTHGSMIYPRTGKYYESGAHPAKGKNVNVAWSARDIGDADYYASFVHLLIPIAMEFNPELVFVSAGFDCAEGDPLGAMKVSTKGFAQMLSFLMGLANGRVVCALEGGYDVDNTAQCAAICLKVLMDQKLSADITNLNESSLPSIHGWGDIANTVSVHAEYWHLLREVMSDRDVGEYCKIMKELQEQVEPPTSLIVQ